METTGRLRLADVFVSIQYPCQAAKVEHDLMELLVVAVNTVLVGAGTLVEIELWATEKLDWLRGSIPKRLTTTSSGTTIVGWTARLALCSWPDRRPATSTNWPRSGMAPSVFPF